MTVDPLSDVLSLLEPRTYVAGGFDLGGRWSIQFDPHTGIKWYAVTSGACWLAVEGTGPAVPLAAGDCVLLPNGRRFSLTSDPALSPVPLKALFPDEWRDGIATLNGGGTEILGGHFAFAGAEADMLLATMPPLARLKDDGDRANLRWVLDRMRHELNGRQPGGVLVARHLAHMLLVQALRLYLADGVGRHAGWLFALGDPRLAAAIGAIHARPDHRWTLPALAAAAGMSRSSFAQRFKAAVGAAPVEYLTKWRMVLAGERLARGNEPTSVISRSLGYDSESAFSTAFKRVMDVSPRVYARNGSSGLRVRRIEVVDGRAPTPDR